MIDEIANEILIASRIMHTNVVSTIAQEIGYRPMLIITALYKGTEDGKFTYNKKRDTITQGEGVDVDNLLVTEAMRELIDMINQFMHYQNTKEETDMTIDELAMLIGGIPDLHLKMAVRLSKKLSTYEIADPKDKKSVYTFITLTENLDKKWGKKQFNAKKTKARKHVDRASRKKADE